MASLFKEALNGINEAFDFDSFKRLSLRVYKNVDSYEELKQAKVEVGKVSRHLLATNPEFKARIMRNRERAARRHDDTVAKSRQSTPLKSRIASERAHARSDSMIKRRLQREVLGEKVKIDVVVKASHQTQVEAKPKLICPICRGGDRGNQMNEVPICFHSSSKYGRPHRLVSEDDLSQYNRVYRRQWMNNK